MWKNFKEKIASWIPEHVPGRVIVALYELLDIFNFSGKKIRKNNFDHNHRILSAPNSPLMDGYIQNQWAWEEVHFGKTTMAFAGCEIMAVYNILLSQGYSGGCGLMTELISSFEKNGAALQGRIGTSPLAIKRYLEKQGIKTRLVWNDTQLSDAKAFIATVFNDSRDLYAQIHTIAFIKEDDGYISYNAVKSGKGFISEKAAIESVSDNPKLICAIELLDL